MIFGAGLGLLVCFATQSWAFSDRERWQVGIFKEEIHLGDFWSISTGGLFLWAASVAVCVCSVKWR